MATITLTTEEYAALVADRDALRGECDGLRGARCQLPWPVGVNYPGRWKRGMMGLAFRL